MAQAVLFLRRKEVSMATTRIMSIHISKGKTTAQSLKERIAYILNPRKTEEGHFVTSYECAPQTAAQEFLLTKKEYRSITGRTQQNDVIAYHLRQAFVPGEITPEEANRVGYEMARRFLKGNHAFLVATHTDKAHIHNHIIWNSTALDGRRKFRDFKRSGEAIARLSDTICVENRLSIVPEPRGKGKRYDQWQGDQQKLSQREMLRIAIDDTLAQQPADLNELLSLLQKAGWEIKRGKHIALRGPGETRFKRLGKLGEGYTEEALCAILSGEKEHKPRAKRTPVQPSRRVSLLVDIQAKLREGKGAGYERWAKRFNNKELANTLNFISEHGVVDYDDLATQTEAATERANDLMAAIRQAETRMTEIKVLETHIINYLKTKDVFAAYHASGYSKAFAAAHEQELALCRASKAAFNELGLQKLPTIKMLRSEYAELIEQKKQAYRQYRQARDEMRDLVRTKANVEMILEMDDTHKHDPKQKNKVR